MKTPSIRAVAVLALLVAACGEQPLDWSAPENLLLRESSRTEEDAAVLEYQSLIDATCSAVYEALADVEHYPEFIPGVDRAQLLGVTDTTKTVQLAQRVISRQSNAKVEWTFDAARPHIEFKTLQSDLSHNDGTYDFESSPDGKRCLVRSKFLVRAGAGQPIPVGVLASATRDAFLAAAKGVAKRVQGGAG